MKRTITVFICAVAMVLFAGCSVKYSEEDFLGKTSSQIEAEFGLFDCCGMPPDANGLYQNTACGYTVEKPQPGFLGTSPEILYFISFDENGVAYACHEGNRPGG